MICQGLAISSWAGQVVTDATKSWAKKALQQEDAIGSEPAFNTLAVLYFDNKTECSELDILRKGLTITLTTDLSRVKGIQLVERVKMQALAEELDLGVTGIVDAKSMPRVGRLLGAAHLVGGDILKQKNDRFQLKAGLLKVPTETTFGNAKAEGKLIQDFFRMEKDLLFDIIRALKIELGTEQQAALRRPLTKSLKALRFFIEGIEHSDLGDYEKANESYAKALQEDPNLALAEEAIQEIESMGAEAYSAPSPPPKSRSSGKKCQGKRNKLLRGMRR